MLQVLMNFRLIVIAIETSPLLLLQPAASPATNLPHNRPKSTLHLCKRLWAGRICPAIFDKNFGSRSRAHGTGALKRYMRLLSSFGLLLTPAPPHKRFCRLPPLFVPFYHSSLTWPFVSQCRFLTSVLRFTLHRPVAPSFKVFIFVVDWLLCFLVVVGSGSPREPCTPSSKVFFPSLL